jgi:hypothetical protein
VHARHCRIEELIDQRLAPMLVSHRTHKDKSYAGTRAHALQRSPKQTSRISVSGCGVDGGFQGLGAVLAEPLEACPSTSQGAGTYDSTLSGSAGSRSGLPVDKTQTVSAWLGNSSAAPATVPMEAAPAVASGAASRSLDGPAGNGSGANTRGGPSRPWAGAGSRLAMLDRGVDTVRAGPTAAAAGSAVVSGAEVGNGAEAGSVRGSDGGGGRGAGGGVGGRAVGRGTKRLPTPAGGGAPGSAQAPSVPEAEWARRAGAVGPPLLLPLPVLRYPRRTRRADAGVRGEAGRSPEKDSEQK